MTNTGFADSNLSARVRDAMEKIARNVVREEGVTYRYGTVTAIDYDGGKVDVQFPGSAISVPVRSLGIQPTQVGQVVQVASRKNDHFVNGVVGASGIVSTGGSGLVAPVIVIKQFVESIVGDWDPVAGAFSYEFQVSSTNDFSADVFTYQTAATQYIFPTDEFQTGYYVRVRAIDGSTPPQAGPWSNVAGPVAPATGGGGAPPTDGTVPDDSPDVTLVPGIGYLQAKWEEDNTNPDPVAYEVHISTSSGFTPDVTTFYDVTGSNTLFIRSMPDGSPLQYDTNYYVRLLAFDFDGKALVPGAQAIAQINRVETGDAGNIGISNVSDGAVPSQSPSVKTVTGGIGYLFVTWDHVPNDDTVHYELHLSTVNDFNPTSNTKVGDTPSNFFFIREQGPGALSAPLDYAVTYYVKIIAYDADGYAASFGLQGSGSVPMVEGVDIGENSVSAEKMIAGTITAASGIIADAAIGTAKIQDAAITDLKVADAAIKSAHIDLLQVNNGHIADLSAAKITAGTISGEEIILSGITGILRSSNYVAGSAGWRIRGDGSLEMNSGTFRGALAAATGTFAGSLSAATGTFSGDLSAAGGTFSGNLSAAGGTFTGNLSAVGGTFTGTLSGVDGTFSGTISASTITGTTITGGTIQTDGSGNRVKMAGGGNKHIVEFLTGSTSRGLLGIFSTNTVVHLRAYSGYSALVSSDSAVNINYGSANSTFSRDGTDKILLGNVSIAPSFNNDLLCGIDGRAWSAVWAYSHPTASDPAIKSNIQESNLGLSFLRSLQAISWNWTDGGVRPHYGIHMDSLTNFLTANGLDFGGYKDPAVNSQREMIAYPQLDANGDPIIDPETGSVLRDAPVEEPVGPRGIDYTEFVGPIVKAIQEVADLVDALSDRLDIVETDLGIIP